MRRNKTKRVSSEHTSDPGWVEFQDKSTKEKERMSLKKCKFPIMYPCNAPSCYVFVRVLY